MGIKTYYLLSFCFAAATAIPASAAGIVLTVDPAQSNVAVNGTMKIDLTVSGLGDLTAPSLSAFDLDLRFDSKLVSITNIVYGSSSASGDQLNLSNSDPLQESDASVPGDLHLLEVSLDSPSTLDSQQLGAFTLAELTLHGDAVGTTALSLVVNSLGDSQGDPLSTTSVIGANLSVTPSTAIPEPRSFALFGWGSLVLFFLRLRLRGLRCKVCTWTVRSWDFLNSDQAASTAFQSSGIVTERPPNVLILN